MCNFKDNFKSILKEQGMKVRAGFVWLGIGNGCRTFSAHDNETSVEFLNQLKLLKKGLVPGW
jgi:hypothetical protein